MFLNGGIAGKNMAYVHNGTEVQGLSFFMFISKSLFLKHFQWLCWAEVLEQRDSPSMTLCQSGQLLIPHKTCDESAAKDGDQRPVFLTPWIIVIYTKI